MDPELFKKRLEEIAELKQAKVPRAAGRAEATEPEIIKRGDQTFSIDLKDNPTIAWTIKKLKPHVAVCEDCRQVVENRLVEIKHYDLPNGHWRKNCKGCNKSQNPYSGKFDVDNKKIFHVYCCYLKDLPEPYLDNSEEEKPNLKPHFKKPAK
jgi:hypothetical protein